MEKLAKVKGYTIWMAIWSAINLFVSFSVGYILKYAFSTLGISVQEYIGVLVFCLKIPVVLSLVATVLTFMNLIENNIFSIFPLLVSVTGIALALMSKIYFELPDSVFYPLIRGHCLVILITVCLPLLLKKE